MRCWLSVSAFSWIYVTNCTVEFGSRLIDVYLRNQQRRWSVSCPGLEVDNFRI